MLIPSHSWHSGPRAPGRLITVSGGTDGWQMVSVLHSPNGCHFWFQDYPTDKNRCVSLVQFWYQLYIFIFMFLKGMCHQFRIGYNWVGLGKDIRHQLFLKLTNFLFRMLQACEGLTSLRTKLFEFVYSIMNVGSKWKSAFQAQISILVILARCGLFTTTVCSFSDN